MQNHSLIRTPSLNFVLRFVLILGLSFIAGQTSFAQSILTNTISLPSRVIDTPIIQTVSAPDLPSLSNDTESAADTVSDILPVVDTAVGNTAVESESDTSEASDSEVEPVSDEPLSSSSSADSNTDDAETVGIIRIEPNRQTISIGEEITFSAFAGESVLDDITWIVSEEAGGDINDSGVYTAPEMAGVFHIIARRAGATQSGVATVIVRLQSIRARELDISETTDATDSLHLATTSTTTVISEDATRPNEAVREIIATSSNLIPVTLREPVDTNKPIVPQAPIAPIRQNNINNQPTVPVLVTPRDNLEEKKIVLEPAVVEALKLIRNTRNTTLSGGTSDLSDLADTDLLYKDTNSDGISDYDSINIYNLDPIKPSPKSVFDGKSITAGEKILLGFDPAKEDLVKVIPEEPDISSAVVAPAYVVADVELTPEKKITIKGLALPNSFITVYIYSTPIIVTVRTNDRGEWQYTLDNELDNGQHEIYTATVNNTGKILVKSSAFAFTKTAEAATLETLPPMQISADVNSRPGMLNGNNFFIILGIILVVVSAVMLVIGRKNRVNP